MREFTSLELIALTKIFGSELDRYVKLLELFYTSKIISEEQIDELTKHCKQINESLPEIKTTYLDQQLLPLRKARIILTLLVQREKGKEIGYPNIDKLFNENLENIHSFFTRFGLSEELSTPPGSNEERPLHQRVINPYADDSKDFKRTVKDMVHTATSVKEESNENWKKLALSIKDEYEGKPTPVDEGTKAISELFLEGIKHLREREAKLKLSEARVQQLSATKEETKLNRKQSRKKIDDLLEAATEGVING